MDLYVNIDRNYQNLDTPDKFNQQTPNPIKSSKAISDLPQDTS
jgi:hypothetical protein